MSARLRVKRRTSLPARCAWMRAPSSFHSIPAAAEPAQGARDVVSGLRQHRRDGMQRSEPEPRESGCAFPHRHSRNGSQISREHRRPSNVSDRKPGRPCDRVGHHAFERALAKLAEEQPDEQPLLGLGRMREELGQRLTSRTCEPFPEIRWSRVTAASTSRSSSEGASRRRRVLPERRPPHADRSLRQFAGEIGDCDRNLTRARRGQQHRDPLDLLQTRRRPCDFQRRGGDLVQEQGLPLRVGRARPARHDRDATRPRPPRWRGPAPASSPRR